jgi:cysteinyl-tRNA synthetase
MIFYNVLSKKKEVFRPIKKGAVKFYTCGPTIYDFVHIGNLKTYIFEDILRRSLKYNGYKVKQVMNLTDVEDKIIKRAKAENKNISEVTGQFAEAFFKDVEKLNIEKAEVYPRATEHIKEMLDITAKLVKKGIAYKGKDNSIYFDISKFKNYGKLSNLKKKEILIGARIEADEYSKKEAQDYVLWKARKDDEPFWPSAFGDGRPGWHIECSAMSIKHLGKTLDIHAGAVDLIFPHHENEIAISESSTGKKFVNYWIEGEHLLVGNQKMSKSLKNFYTLKDIEAKGFNPLSFRYLILGTHYRRKLNFTWESLAAAENGLNNLYAAYAGICGEAEKEEAGKPARKKEVAGYEKIFKEAINDDLNTSKAFAVAWKVIKDRKLPAKEKIKLLDSFDKVFGLKISEGLKQSRSAIPKEVEDLLALREQARVNKQFIQADALRKNIEALGYTVEDTPEGPKAKMISQK